MNNELFKTSDVESVSPLTQWMNDNDIKTKKREDLHGDPEPWEAWSGDYSESLHTCIDGSSEYPSESPVFSWGATEQDAIDQLAINMKNFNNATKPTG